MNDFTKEDLEDIANALENWVPDHIGLREKIQSMIENYCDHEFDMTNWTNDSSGCRWYECKKCKGCYR